MAANAGEFCVVERNRVVDAESTTDEAPRRDGRWEAMGTITMDQDGFVAVIPQDMFILFDPALLATMMDMGVMIEFEDQCRTLKLTRRDLRIGKGRTPALQPRLICRGSGVNAYPTNKRGKL